MGFKSLINKQRLTLEPAGHPAVSVYVTTGYLQTESGPNCTVLQQCGIEDKGRYCSRWYGYGHGGGDWPEFRPNDFDALGRVFHQLQLDHKLVIFDESTGERLYFQPSGQYWIDPSSVASATAFTDLHGINSKVTDTVSAKLQFTQDLEVELKPSKTYATKPITF